MAKTTEKKLVFRTLYEGKIVLVKIANDNKNIEVVSDTGKSSETAFCVVNTDKFDKFFPIIDPRQLIEHKLLEHNPKTRRQEELMVDIRKSIEVNLPAFRVSCMDPSEENGEIIFKPGNKPATEKADTVGWDEIWKNFMPSMNSRMGTDLHWAAFCGKQMKYLVEEKSYSVEDAWNVVCDDSRDLGHYWNSNDSGHALEPTGSRKVGEHFDLINTYKILKKWESRGYLAAGGSYMYLSYQDPLASLRTIEYPNFVFEKSVGWLVLDV